MKNYDPDMPVHKVYCLSDDIKEVVQDQGTYHMRVGYQDARDGKPFRKAYDYWNEDQQHNYELGRKAFHMREAGMRLRALKDEARFHLGENISA